MSSESSIDIWIVEDDERYRNTLSKAFENTADIQCTQSFVDCEAVLKWLKADEDWIPPDVILLDVNLPGMSGITGVGHLKASIPDTYIVMLTIMDDTETIFDAFRAGASGYLLKNAPFAKITAAIREASQGGTLMPAEVADKVLGFFAQKEAKADYGLTQREQEVLQEMAEGYSQKEIAARLFISAFTVNTHIQNIYNKLHVHSGIEAVSKALRERIIK